MRWLAIFLLGLGTAHAEVYRCQQDGRTVYTDKPCTPGAEPEDLPKLQVVKPSELEQRMAEDYDRSVAREKAVRDKADKAWVKEHKAKAADDARLKKAQRQGKVAAGMDARQVRDVYGEPDTIKKSERKGGAVKETWTYHLDGGVQTVEFSDGRVSRHSEKKSKKKSK